MPVRAGAERRQNGDRDRASVRSFHRWPMLVAALVFLGSLAPESAGAQEWHELYADGRQALRNGQAARGSGVVPSDPCSLLKVAEIQTLAPKANVGTGLFGNQPLGIVVCEYKWGSAGSVQAGRYQLQVIVGEASRMFPGVSPTLIKDGLLAQAKQGDPNMFVIPDVGDAALFESSDVIRAKATALVKGQMLSVIFEAADARAHKDHVIALLKAAAARL